MVLDRETQRPKGFAFVTFLAHSDAEEALFNMHECELLARTVNCKWASAERDHKANEAVWKGETWLKEHGEKENLEADEEVRELNPIN